MHLLQKCSVLNGSYTFLDLEIFKALSFRLVRSSPREGWVRLLVFREIAEGNS